MAGTDSRFNATLFRDSVRFAMQMGFPQDSAQQITWRWTPNRSYLKPDSGGFPFEWAPAQIDTEVDVTDFIVTCAVEFKPTGGATRVGGTELGIMDVATAIVTLLDTDYDALLAHGNNIFPDLAVLDGNVYVPQIKGPPQGLFSVTVYSVYLQAIDES